MKRKKMVVLCVVAGMVLVTSCGNMQDIVHKGMVESGDITEVSEVRNEREANTEIRKFKSVGIIDETVMVDESDVKIIATDLIYTDNSVKLNLTIENNSDFDLSFVSGSVGYSQNAINGYMISGGFMNVDVPTGKKTNESIEFNIDELLIYGITEIADIQVGFKISDDDYHTIYEGVGQVKTSVSDLYDYKVDTFAENLKSGILETMAGCSVDYYSEDEIYSKNGVRIIAEALVTNKDGEKTMFIEIENNSSEMVCGATSGISLNGLIVYSALWSSDEISPNTRCVVGLSLSSMLDESYWDLFGISEIGNMTFTFAATDGEWNEVAPPQEVSIALQKKVPSVSDKGKEIYNKDGIRIVSKGLMEDPSKYSDDIHMLFLIENNYADTIEIEDEDDSLSINGYMVDYTAGSREIPSGKYAVIDVEMDKSSLEDSGIVEITDIQEAEIMFEIDDSKHNNIAEPKLLIQY